MLIDKVSEVILEIGVDSECFEEQRKMLSKFLLEMRKTMDHYTYNGNFVSKQKTVCSYCGHDWTDEEYDGSCCKKATEEFMKAMEGAACGGL